MENNKKTIKKVDPCMNDVRQYPPRLCACLSPLIIMMNVVSCGVVMLPPSVMFAVVLLRIIITYILILYMMLMFFSILSSCLLLLFVVVFTLSRILPSPWSQDRLQSL